MVAKHTSSVLLIVGNYEKKKHYSLWYYLQSNVCQFILWTFSVQCKPSQYALAEAVISTLLHLTLLWLREESKWTQKSFCTLTTGYCGLSSGHAILERHLCIRFHQKNDQNIFQPWLQNEILILNIYYTTHRGPFMNFNGLPCICWNWGHGVVFSSQTLGGWLYSV